MSLPSAQDMATLICRVGNYILIRAHFSTVVMSHAYKQLPLDPADWYLLFSGVCVFRYVTLPFGNSWAAASCQDTTPLVTNHLNNRGLHILNYIDDFGGVVLSKVKAETHFNLLQTTLQQLGLVEAKNKASPPAMIWLGLQFDTTTMTITIHKAKLTEIADLVAD